MSRLSKALVTTIQRQGLAGSPDRPVPKSRWRPTLRREVVRNMSRRKLRTALTVAGIGLGAYALTVLGSLAENLNASIASMKSVFEEQVIVRPVGSTIFWFSGANLSASLASELEKIRGVESVVPRSQVNLEEERRLGIGLSPRLFGLDLERARHSPISRLKLASGRMLVPGDRWKVVLGSRAAQRFSVSGPSARSSEHKLEIRKHSFEVVGIIAATATPADDWAFASIEDIRQIQTDEDPHRDVHAVVSEFLVYPKEGVDSGELAKQIKPVVGEALVFTPDVIGEQIRGLAAIWNSIIYGAALVALVIGGVAIINTMVFSVTERTREIGIKKAVGASSRHVLHEFVLESTILSMVGGLLGGFAGYMFILLLNAVRRNEGVVSFLMTPRLAGLVFIITLVVGIGAGILPARRAARMDPVKALRTGG